MNSYSNSQVNSYSNSQVNSFSNSQMNSYLNKYSNSQVNSYLHGFLNIFVNVSDQFACFPIANYTITRRAFGSNDNWFVVKVILAKSLQQVQVTPP